MEASSQEIASLERLVGAQGGSPLFARLADLYLEAGRPQDALRVCDAGLAAFPFYSTGHFVKGKTLIALHMTNEARRELEFVRDWLPTNPTVWSLLDLLPVDETQTLEPSETIVAEEPPSFTEPVADVAATEPSPAPAEANFFSAITDAAPPTAAVDTGEAPAAPVQETNVFGLPTEVPSGFGGFGGFGGATETPAAEPENPMAAFGGFGGAEAPATVGSTDAFGSVEDPAPAIASTAFETLAGSETFEIFADRMRNDLGPTGLTTLEQFLSDDGGTAAVTDAFAGVPAFDAAPEAPSFDLPTPGEDAATAVAEAATEPAEATSFDGLPSFGATETTPSPSVEEAPSAELDLSGFPSTEAAPPASETPAAPAEESGGFSGPAFDGPAPAADTSIEGLTAKLQTAKKITPVIDFTSKSSSDDDGGTMASSSFVTPTLAEIYAKQGWFDDAIKAYRTLAKSKPAEREKFEARIAELEEEKKKQG